MDWAQLTSALLPYRFSWLAVLFFGAAGLAFARGCRVRIAEGNSLPRWRQVLFWLGLLLAYGVMHTRFDYYAQFMFFIHRGQHLVLHHLAPLLIALSSPWHTLAKGVPEGALKTRLASVVNARPVQWGYRILQFPPVAAFLFVGLIFFWLQPYIHFYAMLSEPRYLLMNWSVWLDGLLFWWLILDPRPPRENGTLGLGKRILLIWAVTVPQLGLGAHIATSKTALYDVYEVCGRAWPIDPVDDQVLGGILTWIPPGMMAVLAMLVVLRRLLHQSESSVSFAGGEAR